MTCINRRDLGLLVLRVGTGAVLAAHGTQKLFGWFGGGGIEGTAAAMEHMGFRPGKQSAVAAGLGEAGGGALLALGLATPAAGARRPERWRARSPCTPRPGSSPRAAASSTPRSSGSRPPRSASAGAGRYSLDHASGHVLDRPWTVALAFLGSAAAAALVVGRRAQDQDDGDPEGERAEADASPEAGTSA